MEKGIDDIERVLTAPYPNSTFMFLQLADLEGSCDTEKDKKQLVTNLTSFFNKFCPSVFKLFPEYEAKDLVRAIQIVPYVDYTHRLVLLRNVVGLLITRHEELEFSIDGNIDATKEEYTSNFLDAIRKKKEELDSYIAGKPIVKSITFSYLYRDYICKKFKVSPEGAFKIMAEEKSKQYGQILSSSSILTSSDEDSSDIPTFSKVVEEISSIVGFELFSSINPDKLELVMAHRFIIDFNHYIAHIKKESDAIPDNDTINESAPEYIDFLKHFVNKYNEKRRHNPKFGFSIKTVDPKTGEKLAISCEKVAMDASKILERYPDAIDMGDSLKYRGMTYEEVKDLRKRAKVKAIEEEANRRREEEEKEALKVIAEREAKEEQQRVTLIREEIYKRMREESYSRDREIGESLSSISRLTYSFGEHMEKLNKLFSKTDQSIKGFYKGKEDLEAWRELLVEDMRNKARQAAIKIVNLGGTLFSPPEAQEMQRVVMENEVRIATEENDRETLQRIEELARRQEFYYKNLDVIAVIKFRDMDIYVSSSGCLYTEPANQSGIGHNAIYVLHYSNARQLFTKGIVKQDVRNEQRCSEGHGKRFYFHTSKWEKNLVEHDKEARANNTDPEGVYQFVEDMRNEILTGNIGNKAMQKSRVFSSNKDNHNGTRN